MKVIFNIENRGDKWIFHFIIFMIGGFRHIEFGNITQGNDSTYKLNQNIEQYNKTKKLIKQPYYIYFSYGLQDYARELLDIIKDKFIVITKPDINTSDIIVSNYGEKIKHGYVTDNKCYVYLRKLFLDKINANNFDSAKKIYIRRHLAYTLPGNKGIKRRHIINEEDLCIKLKDIGFQIIILEELSAVDKIKLFNSSSIIISPSSGALTFSLFANKETKIIEINTISPHQVDLAYEKICSTLKITHIFYRNVKKVDRNDNMTINVIKFIDFINYHTYK